MALGHANTIVPPKCCTDAAGGEMTPTAEGWVCVWCGREFSLADYLREHARQRSQYDRTAPPPTSIPGGGRSVLS